MSERLTSNVLKASLAYFGFVFGAGFVLGVIRTLVLVPRVGVRVAELIEAPVMLVVTVLAARWVMQRLRVPAATGIRLLVGLIALMTLLAVEFTVVLWLRGLTVAEYFRERDPISGGVYVALLLLFAAMPVIVVNRKS